jgi:hypothetical protein
MRRPALLLLALVVAACGHKIGDSCTVSTDCASDGTRVCDTLSPGGACTIAGCDFGTCPEDSICVRFFAGLEDGKECTTQAECAIDEVCTLGGGKRQCAKRSLEQRFCMPTCGGDGDCRDAYECRDEQLMKDHGGEPVPDPVTNEFPDDKFCASRRSCSVQADCPDNLRCDRDTGVCQPM